jgi:AraC-like DNA-binding protein
MSTARQSEILASEGALRTSADTLIVRSLAVTYRDGHQLEHHSHTWGQLIYAGSGTMRVSTETATWLVPPTRAIWAPARVTHAIRMRGTTAMRTLYIAPSVSADVTGDCRALEVSPLLRELVLHIVARGALHEDCDADQRLCGVLIDLLAASRATPLGLPLPRDRRARVVAERLLTDPSEHVPLVELARAASMSLRTLQRRFALETGMSVEAWRMRARLQHGLAFLANGASVTTAAIEAGYATPSAFIAAFKQCFGDTPKRYRAGC